VGNLLTYRADGERLATAPLADRMRPRTLDELLGQESILGEGTLFRRAIEDDHPFSMILWGPPGCGKTTLARLLAATSNSTFVGFSAVTCGVKEVRALVGAARERLALSDKKTILFIDEIHRFNKAQQDAFLPHIENGTIILVGATTENPSFEVNSALLSRARVLVLSPLSIDAVRSLLKTAISDEERGLGSMELTFDEDAITFIAEASNGDARRALNALEVAANVTGQGKLLTVELATQSLERAQTLYDKDGEQHYDLISALHKSLRSSDPQAALYWLGRMLAGGEAPLFIARRLVRFASEDIGLADPTALVQALAAKDTVHFIGLPEADCALAQAVVYLATAPKSNALYRAVKRVKKIVTNERPHAVPLHLRNAPTEMMKDLGYSSGYRYDHDEPDGFSGQKCLPPELEGRVFYSPGRFGFEKDIRRRLDYWRKLRNKKPSDD